MIISWAFCILVLIFCPLRELEKRYITILEQVYAGLILSIAILFLNPKATEIYMHTYNFKGEFFPLCEFIAIMTFSLLIYLEFIFNKSEQISKQDEQQIEMNLLEEEQQKKEGDIESEPVIRQFDIKEQFEDMTCYFLEGVLFASNNQLYVIILLLVSFLMKIHIEESQSKKIQRGLAFTIGFLLTAVIQNRQYWFLSIGQGYLIFASTVQILLKSYEDHQSERNQKFLIFGGVIIIYIILTLL